MVAFHLPVSGIDVLLRPPAGAEDILLAEATALDTRLALALAGALGQLTDGGAVPWAELPITDLDAALLAIRGLSLGDHVRSSVVCAAPGCGAPIDLAFGIADYLAHHAPRAPRGVSPASEPGWLQLEGTEAVFRLPSGADQLAVAGAGRAGAERALAARCLRPGTVSSRLRRRVEAAMEALAPSLYDDLEGRCPECAATVRIPFDPQRYVLRELRERAVFVYEEVHLIAGHYRWSERDILDLPGRRRARYAELAHDARTGG